LKRIDPQRLKPRGKGYSCGASEAAPFKANSN
jgi:hypothetical protein